MNRRLKVAHVLASLSTGGMEKVVVDILNRLDKEKIDSSVYCITEERGFADSLRKRGIDVFLIKGNRHPLSLAFNLAKLFKKEQNDIVHSYSGIYRDATLAGLLTGIPIRIHTDQGKFYPDNRWSKFNHWLFSHYRDRVTAVSNELREFLEKEIRISPAKLVRIYNGVDIADHDIELDVNQKKKELGIPLSSKIIGIVARLQPVKDHKTLFTAFKKVRENIGDVKLLVVGDGLLLGALRDFAVKLGEQDNIYFLGKRNDVKELLHIMDIVCLSSLSEGLSLTLAEAMASGKPVVATNVGGNPELIVDGVTGLIVPPRDPDRMAEAIAKLLKEEQLRKSMGEAAKKRIEKEFNINNIVKQYEELYFELARQKGILKDHISR